MVMKLTKFDLASKRKSLCKNVITKYFLETYCGVLVPNYTKWEVLILNTLDLYRSMTFSYIYIYIFFVVNIGYFIV